MKKILVTAAFLAAAMAMAQVGINNSDPKATLDVTAKTTDGSKPEGIIAPRLTGDQIKSGDLQYDTPQIGTIIYATSAVGTSTPKTINITSPGYYYFDNNLVWQKFTGSAGAADTTNDAWINDPTNTMVKLGTNSDATTARAAGTEMVIKDNGNLGVGTAAPATPAHFLLADNSTSTRNVNGQSFTTKGLLVEQDVTVEPASVWYTQNLFTSTLNNPTSSTKANSVVTIESLIPSTSNATNLTPRGLFVNVENNKALTGTIQGSIYNVKNTANLTANMEGNFIFMQNNNGATINRMYGYILAPINTGTITNELSAFRISGFSNTGTIGTTRGIDIGNLTGGTQTNAPYSIHSVDANARMYHAGKIGIGTAAPSNALHVVATADPVRFEGLQSGAATDNVVVADGTGVLKTLPASTFGGSGSTTEPWYVQGGTTQATSNTQNIYQTGRVAINKSTTTKQLDVAGDFRTEYGTGTRFNVIDNNPSAGGNGVAMFEGDTNSRPTATELNYVEVSQAAGSRIGSRNGPFASPNTASSLYTFTTSGSATTKLDSKGVGGYNHMELFSGSVAGANYINLVSQASQTAGNLQSGNVMVRDNKGVQFFYTDSSGSTTTGDYTFPTNNGLANQVLTTDGSGFAATLSWKNVAPATTNDLSGSGNAFACINPTGQIYRSATPCTP